MHSIILAVTQSPQIEHAIRNIESQLCSSVIFISRLRDYHSISRKNHVGLLVVEYAIVRYLTDEERVYFYSLDCPKVVITSVKDEVFSFPIPVYVKLGEPGNLLSENLGKLINEYFRPLPPGSRFSTGTEIQFITRDSRMLKIYQSALKVARYNTHVLLLGENGTGKDVLAHLIHQNSKRNEHAIVKINCAAIPATLLETEMFGYRKGAFTDAFRDKMGKVQLANGSTLFLDEIGDLDASLQGKLLRVLETGEVDVIGGLQPVKVDVRFISATNQDLKQAVKSGTFREDLYYRINVVYHWPGNVRELRHFSERLVLRCQDNEFDPKMVEEEIDVLDYQHTSKAVDSDLNRFMENQEKQFLLRWLTKNDFKILKTASDLGISRISLFRKMKKYRIDPRQLKASNKSGKK
ncbi:hypothetical protein B1H10_07535 [candidate division KSB1 bacterium 4484_188]|nr:MAG: hypothetical protein B1H10_07535 [candidate division KSB1 bacterium 4484_188]